MVGAENLVLSEEDKLIQTLTDKQMLPELTSQIYMLPVSKDKGKKFYDCGLCGFRFSQLSYLNDHMVSHLNENNKNSSEDNGKNKEIKKLIIHNAVKVENVSKSPEKENGARSQRNEEETNKVEQHKNDDNKKSAEHQKNKECQNNIEQSVEHQQNIELHQNKGDQHQIVSSSSKNSTEETEEQSVTLNLSDKISSNIKVLMRRTSTHQISLQPISPTSLQPVSPYNLQPVSQNYLQPVSQNNLQPDSPKNFHPVLPKNLQLISPKTLQIPTNSEQSLETNLNDVLSKSTTKIIQTQSRKASPTKSKQTLAANSKSTPPRSPRAAKLSASPETLPSKKQSSKVTSTKSVYPCAVCPDKFYEHKLFQQHVKDHLDDGTEDRMNNLKMLKDDLSAITNICETCNMMFVRNKDFEKHKLVHHKDRFVLKNLL